MSGQLDFNDGLDADPDGVCDEVDDSGAFSVGEVCGLIEAALRVNFPEEIWVDGEIEELRRANSGHVFFRLKEIEWAGGTNVPTIPVTLFKWTKEQVNNRIREAGGGIRMDDGVRVRIRAKVELYRSEVRLRMSAIDPVFTIGGLLAERDRLIAALTAEGVLRHNARFDVPDLPLRVALITSRGSAAAADFLHEIEISGLGFEVLLIDARVQGVEAPDSIVAALAMAADLDPDVIALVRGGGARTDLAAFDHERIARAICACPVPVFTGIGHEIDRAVADEVAHTAHKTPTACAAAIVERVASTHAEVERLWATAADRAVLALERAGERLGHVARRVPAATRGGLREGERRVEHLWDRSVRAAASRLDREAGRLDTFAARATANDPGLLLARGWSITRTLDGRTVRSAADVGVGDELITTVLEGRIHSRVERLDVPATHNDPIEEDA